MTGEPTDARSAVRDALNTAVNRYGRRVLSDPGVLGNLVTGLLPDFPRERSLLVTAAQADVAAELAEHVEGQRMDADTAVALAAQSLVRNRALDPAASTWVASEYARALGYQVRSQAAPAWGTPLPPGDQSGYEPTVTAIAVPGSWPSTPPAATPPAAASSGPASPGPNQPPGANASSGDAPTVAPGANPWSALTAAPSPWAAPANQWSTNPPVPPAANQWSSPPAAAPATLWSSNPAPPTAPAGYGPPSYGSGGAGASGPGPGDPGLVGQPRAFGGQGYGGQVPGGPGGPAAWPQAGAAPQPGGPWPSAVPPPRNPRRGLFLGGGVVIGIVVLYFIAAAATHVFPFAQKANSTPAPIAAGSSPAVTSPTSSPAVTPSSGAATPAPTTSLAGLAAGVKPLKVLMPYDLTDLTTECTEQEKIPWTNPGLAKALECQAPDLPDGQIFGYQLDSDADYEKAWANYNKWAEFGTSNTLDCPPGSGNSQGGPNGWYGPRFPKHTGQVLECFTSDSGPVYVWTYPTEDAFLVAQPPKNWSFSKLETWWENNAV